MGEIERVETTFFGWSCDKRGCPAEFRVEPCAGPRYMVISKLEAAAEDAGWTFWVSRSRHAYCPDHGPSKGSKMWRRMARRRDA